MKKIATATNTNIATNYSFQWFKDKAGKPSKNEVEHMKEIWAIVKAQRLTLFSLLCKLHEVACNDDHNCMMVDPISMASFDSGTMFNGVHEGVEHVTAVIMGSMKQDIYALCMARGAERFTAIGICHQIEAIIQNDVVATVFGKGGVETAEINLNMKSVIQSSKGMEWAMRKEEE